MMHLDPLLMAIDGVSYINVWAAVPVVVVLLLWARLMTWIDKDALAAHLPREVLNSGIFGAGLVGFALFFILPGFWMGLGAMVFFILAGIGTYLIMRQQSVGLGDIKQQLGGFFANMFKKKDSGVVEAKAGQVVIVGKNGNPLPSPPAEDPRRVGYEAAQTMLTDALIKDAERIDVRPMEGVASIQVLIDGVPYAAPSMERGAAAAGIHYLKAGAGLDIEDRRKPQKGTVRSILDGKRQDLQINTAGSMAGESLTVVVNPKKRHEFQLADLGLLPEQLEAVKASMAENVGIVLVSAPRDQGLTSLLYSLLRGHDAFLSHIQTIERVPEIDLEGITQNVLGGNATAAEEQKQVEWITSQQPDVVMIDEIQSPASARELVKFASDLKRVYIGMRHSSTFEALRAWRQLVGDDQLASKSLSLLVAGRVMRRLCPACKIGYAPDPEKLRKLNMDSGRVAKLFQARTQPLRDKKGNPVPCQFCQELHYKGRFGAYEVFLIDGDIRAAIAKGASDNQLKAMFRSQRGLFLQETALARVESGDTSVDEVLRVLRGPTGPTARQTTSAGA